jgi:hypothetical protein
MEMNIRKHYTSFAVIAAAAALSGACMSANQREMGQTAAGQRQCFLAYQVNGFHPIDYDTVQVTVGPRTIYELELFGTCRDINWSERIALRSTSGSSWICQGLDAELLVPSAIGPQRCLVNTIRRLSPEEAKAARARRG